MYHHLKYLIRPNPYTLKRTISGIGEKYHKKQNDIKSQILFATFLTSIGLISIKQAYAEEKSF